jgi:hypothetical protein
MLGLNAPVFSLNPGGAISKAVFAGLPPLRVRHNEAVTFLAPDEPGLTRVKVTVRQRDVVCTGEGLITVAHELMGQLGTATVSSQGLPGYTFERAPEGPGARA